MRSVHLACLIFAAVLAAPAAQAGTYEQLASLAAAAEGTDGCYFGECPEPGAQPPTLPPVEQTQGWPEAEPAPPNQTPWPQTAQLTSICQTPQFWCQMFEYGPVGADCWCADWYGNIHTGWTVAE